MQKLRRNDLLKNSGFTGTNPKRVFMVGCPRSGTTLLQCILGAHSKVATFPETHFFEDFEARWPLNLFGLRSHKAPKKVLRFFQEIERDELFNSMPRGVRSLFQKTYANAFLNILDDMVMRPKKSIWLSKTPNHLMSIPTIKTNVPDAVFIHVVRNGCHTIASLFEAFTKFWHDRAFLNTPSKDRTEFCIQIWEKSVRVHLKHLTDPNHFFIVYDHLFGNAKTLLKETCHFIGIDFEESMLVNYPKIAEAVVLKSEVWKESTKGPIELKTSKFYTLFSEGERSYIHSRISSFCRQELKRLSPEESHTESAKDFLNMLQSLTYIQGFSKEPQTVSRTLPSASFKIVLQKT
jgi:hypothetical protein